MDTVPNLYQRTFDADEMVLLLRLTGIAYELLSLASYPQSVIERTEDLQRRLIGDDLPLQEAIR